MPIRKWLNAATIAGCLFAALVLAACVAAPDYPALDIVSNGLPLLAIGLIVLLIVSLGLRSLALTVTTGGLLAVALGVLLPTLSGAAPQAGQDAERFMRVTTFNLQGKGELHLNRVEDFLDDIRPDAIVLQEVRWQHEEFLKHLKARFPFQTGEHGLVLLSKHPIVDKGRVDRPNEPYWRSLMIKWAELDVNGTKVDLVGTHMARPFYPERQRTDMETLTKFVGSRSGPVIVAGDFNASPWTEKVQHFTDKTGMRWLNTFVPTWPARWRVFPLIPVLPIDNVFISPHLAKVDAWIGPRLESDHLPVVADLALADAALKD